MQHKLKLVKKLIENHGFFKTMFMLAKMMFFALCDLNFSQKNRRLLSEKVKGKRVVVFAKTIEWHNMFQRTQQMALEFSKQPNTVVIYVQANSTHDYFANIQEVSPSLLLMTFKHYDKLNELLSPASQVILYTTNLLEFDKGLSLTHQKMVYEYVDELEIWFDKADMELANSRHSHALKLADVSVATATKLYNQIQPIAKKAILSPNAVDYEVFSKSKETQLSPLLKEAVAGYDMVLGYYGMLAAWFDFELLHEVAVKKPRWLFVLIGTIYDDTLKKFHLNECKNVLIIPPQPYASLPSFIRGIDILTIPFLINNITLSTSPVKLFEYMASGTPILTSKLPECEKYESVYRYEGAQDFIDKANRLYELRNDKEYQALLLKEAKENTWANRVTQVLRALED